VSTTRPEVNERLAALTEAGTSPWLDQIRRSLVEGGELQRLIDELSLRGVTSNPSIFEKAILGSKDYDEDLKALAEEGCDAGEIFRRLSVRDIQLAADVLRPVYDETEHLDGYVSLEVHPRLARDTARGTLEEARALWNEVDRPNVMIKIPGTSEGLEAIEEATYEGININVTLLFSVASYTNVTEAYISGLERRHAEGKDLDIHSVASFFVSRVDSKVDKLLSDERADLRGKAGLANARAAYRRFSEIFHGERFAELKAAGAPVQRPLWASTGVKNPDYSDTMYVDGLVAPETVNTMPMKTLLATGERAEVTGATAEEDPTDVLDALERAGIDLQTVTEELLDEGIETFAKSFDSLLSGVESQREAVVVGRPLTIDSSIPDDLESGLVERIKRAESEDVARRVWSKDESLWGGPGVPEVGNRLGWLTITDTMTEDLPQLMGWAEEVRGRGITDVVLLGMGGSSLGPEVIRRSFSRIDGAPALHVLDSTDPGAVRDVEGRLDLEHAFFIVSSKSGGTIETLSHFKHFFALVGERGERFCAITDPGSPLEAIAAEHGFDRVWRNDPDIGGRYSVLSYFGLVPAALMGVAVDGLLHSAQVAEQNCAHHDSTAHNSGLWLGLALGELARRGRDKLTFVVSEPIASFGLWVEQLVAESTGKQGSGILPVADEPLLDPEHYGDDRVFAYLRNTDAPDAELDQKIRALGLAGQPTLTLSVQGVPDLGRLFFFAEFAVAVAGWVLEINPFDQPNVREAKDATNEVLKSGSVKDVPTGGAAELRELLGTVEPPGYVALHGWLAPSEEIDAAAGELRAAIMEKTQAATTFGYGPRFLHSTGQLHKGGPATGHFVQLVHDERDDIPIPGARYGFKTLEAAQALGDLRALEAHDRPVLRISLHGEPAVAIRKLAGELSG